MAGDNNKSFVRNIARDRTYQNQNKEYDEAYFKWCANESNPYSFNYVQDLREHSYMAGKGFIRHGADTAEQATLHNCLRLLGSVMLVMLLFDAASFILSSYLNGGAPSNIIFYSDRDSIGDSSVLACMVCSALVILKYITAIMIYHMRVKLPLKVALPTSNVKNAFKFNAVVIMLMIVVTGRISNSILSRILGVVGIDSVYIYMFNSTDISAQVVSFIFNCIIVPVLCEIFFRGLVLQSFRQFGDAFAVIVSAAACGLSYFDVSFIGYATLCSLVIGVFTIRSGSIVTAIVMHSVTTTINYLLVFVTIISSDAGMILSCAVYIVICAGALIVYSRLNRSKNWSFNIDRGQSELTLSKKLELMLSSNTVAMWLVCVIVMMIFTMRLLR